MAVSFEMSTTIPGFGVESIDNYIWHRVSSTLDYRSLQI